MKTQPPGNAQLSSASEYALILGAGASAAVSLLTQQVAAASLPMTMLVAMGLMNRRRLDQHLEMVESEPAPSQTNAASETLPTAKRSITVQPQPEGLAPSPARDGGRRSPNPIQFAHQPRSPQEQLRSLQQTSLQKIGSYLQTVRESKALSQRDIHNQTFIQVYMIEAIETGNLKRLPEPFYVRAFLRKYAQALGLDDLAFIEEFPLG